MRIVATNADGDWENLIHQLDESRGELRRSAPLTLPPEAPPASLSHALTSLADRLHLLGIAAPRQVVLVACEHPEYSGEMIADDGGTLFIPVARDATASLVAFISTAVAMTRWRHDWRGWWSLLNARPLRELIYVDGIGRCAAAALLPGVAEHHLLQLSPAQTRRAQERERSLTVRLLRDLESSAAVGWLRWLAEGTGDVARRDAAGVIPLGAGRYLARRFTMRRVQRLGIAGSLAAEAESISAP
jgi:hypothetical protein